jgi:DNA (cytosine-5)-methyltransferase 1
MGSKKWQLVQIGNAVPALLGKAIGIAVMKGIDQIKNNRE